MLIRPLTRSDAPELETALETTQLFPTEMLEPMIQTSVSNEDSSDIWLVCEINGQAVGFAYTIHEPMVEGTFNMRALMVHASHQRMGAGTALLIETEKLLRQRNCRILLVDTSSTDELANARAFYKRNGFIEEARIRDFWAQGDDKVTFWKSLAGNNRADS